MLYSKRLNEYQWGKIYNYLKEFREIYVCKEDSCRRFVEGVLWMARSGSQWRLLDKEYGNWNTVYRRFADWAEKGIWYKMLYYFSKDADMEYIMIDSTILRAHACATPKKNDQTAEGLGRSKGGFSTKIHAVCDALGNPLRFIITAGQRNDCTQAIELLNGLKAEAVLADKGYDANTIIEAIENSGAISVIPPRANRKIQRKYDKDLYKERHKIECLFGFLKHYRRLFSRFDKLKSQFSAFLHFVAALHWLK